MYEAFYGFKEKPFSLTPDPKYLYLSRSHREALDHLLYGVQEREGFVVITGDVGTGKTTLCRALLSRLDARTRTALVLNPILSEEELLRAILQDFGLSAAGASKKELVDELNAFLLRALADGEHAVLIVDESQNLSPRLLEQIRLLSNLETDREKLLQIILVGQLGLLDLLASPELKQLNQRVSVRYQLRPLTFQETCQYVYHRLMVAGDSSAVAMSSAALRRIHRFSGGVPRLINLACDRALLQGFVDHANQITAGRARRAIASLGDEAGRRRSTRRLRVPLVAAILLVAGFTGGWLGAGGWAQRLLALRPTTAAPAAVTTEAPRPFTLLVGAYPTEPEARAVEQQLAARGYSAFVAVRVGPQGETNYGVLVGRYRAAEDAKPVIDRLAGDGLVKDAKVVRVVEAAAGERSP